MQEIQRQADQAMYQAKARGGTMFRRWMKRRSERRLMPLSWRDRGYSTLPSLQYPRLSYNVSRYMLVDMIKTFQCKHTAALFAGERCHRQWQAFQNIAERKLQMLNRANRLEDLRIPPQNRLEALKGDRSGQWSIRINDQWRICFIWSEGDAHDVEIVDYH